MRTMCRGERKVITCYTPIWALRKARVVAMWSSWMEEVRKAGSDRRRGRNLGCEIYCDLLWSMCGKTIPPLNSAGMWASGNIVCIYVWGESRKRIFQRFISTRQWVPNFPLRHGHVIRMKPRDIFVQHVFDHREVVVEPHDFRVFRRWPGRVRDKTIWGSTLDHSWRVAPAARQCWYGWVWLSIRWLFRVLVAPLWAYCAQSRL